MCGVTCACRRWQQCAAAGTFNAGEQALLSWWGAVRPSRQPWPPQEWGVTLAAHPSRGPQVRPGRHVHRPNLHHVRLICAAPVTSCLLSCESYSIDS